MEYLRQYEILFKKAKVDLHTAKLLLKSFNSGDTELELDVIMFHLQQCAEKLLKTLLIYNNYHITKTHDIKKLINLIHESNINIAGNIENLIPLTEFAVEGRYSILHDDLEDTDNYINALNKFLPFVEKAIQKKL